jgi:hypothetical protein
MRWRCTDPCARTEDRWLDYPRRSIPQHVFRSHSMCSDPKNASHCDRSLITNHCSADHVASLNWITLCTGCHCHTLCTGCHCHMAPVKDTHPQHPPTHATMSSTPASSDAFVCLTLGRSTNVTDLLLPPAPPIQSAPDLKARCFDFLLDLLLQHSLLDSSAELIAAFGHVPSTGMGMWGGTFLELVATAECSRRGSCKVGFATRRLSCWCGACLVKK